MNKHKFFLIVLLAGFTVGLSTLAQYVGPTTTAPGNNTPAPLKTNYGNSNVSTYEKIGTGNGTSGPAIGLLANGTYSNLGLHSDTFTSLGTSIINSDLTIPNLTDNGLTDNGYFDKYSNSFTYNDVHTNVNNIIGKKIESMLSGRLISRILISDNKTATPTYDLELRATSGFEPKTNIGLGNTCNLYPANLGSGVGYSAFTGCHGPFWDATYSINEFEMGYMSYYTPPSWTGALNAGNNTNNQVVGTCTFWNPAVNPQNIGACYPNNKDVSNATKTGAIMYDNGYIGEVHYRFFPMTTGSLGSYISQGSGNIWSLVASGDLIPVNTGKNAKYRLSISCSGGTPTTQPVSTPYIDVACPDRNWQPEIQIIDDYGQFKTLPFDSKQISNF